MSGRYTYRYLVPPLVPLSFSLTGPPIGARSCHHRFGQPIHSLDWIANHRSSCIRTYLDTCIWYAPAIDAVVRSRHFFMPRSTDRLDALNSGDLTRLSLTGGGRFQIPDLYDLTISSRIQTRPDKHRVRCAVFATRMAWQQCQ
jgi:hypothetical protein